MTTAKTANATGRVEKPAAMVTSVGTNADQAPYWAGVTLCREYLAAKLPSGFPRESDVSAFAELLGVTT